MKHILLGITGSIAAYKAADLANELTKHGYAVHAVMTAAAAKFITPLTLQTLTKNKVCTDLFEPCTPSGVEHISLAKQASLLLVAPATANFIGKAAGGIADDMLTTLFTAVRQIPVILCPAMNTAMYENPITQRNINLLSALGCRIVEPKEGALACGDLGKGALAETDRILNEVYAQLG